MVRSEVYTQKMHHGKLCSRAQAHTGYRGQAGGLSIACIPGHHVPTQEGDFGFPVRHAGTPPGSRLRCCTVATLGWALHGRPRQASRRSHPRQ